MASKRSVNNEEQFTVTDGQSKRLKMDTQLKVNSLYFNKDTQLFNDIKHAWKSKTSLQTEYVQCINKPFNCWTFNNFIEEDGNTSSCIELLKNDLLKLKYCEKNNDLYQFKQSNDIKSCKSTYLRQFRQMLCDQVLPWLRDLTEIQLTEVIDASCSRYDYTDILLCHDDQLEGRKIAFIYYLVDESWRQDDGGTLDLFNIDEYGQPKEIMHSIIPKYNNLLLFEVSSVSYHQVSEILCPSKPRLSISGWFHGPSPVVLNTLPCNKPHPLPYKEPLDKPLSILEEWINTVYIDIGCHNSIRQQFENESQIELPNFLKEDKYKQLCTELRQCTAWNTVGPPNKRCVTIATTSDSNTLINECLTLFLSEPFCLLLSHLTSLSLTSRQLQIATDSSQGNPCRCHGNWYLWQHGNYTLMSDEEEEFILQVKLYFNCDDWEYDIGGYTSYIAKDEDDELLTIHPQCNSLQLIYKDKDTISFTKYINGRSVNNNWYSIETNYKEQ